MTAVVKHPNGSRLHVADDTVDMYLRAGWAKVEAANKSASDPKRQQDKPAKHNK